MTVAAIGESEREALALLGGEVHLPLSFVLDQAYLRQGDAAFMGGSLIEGTGNRYSDIDVHVVTPALRIEREIDLRSHYRVLSRDRSILRGTTPESDVFLIHTVIPGTAVKVDIEYRTADEIERLIAEVRNIFDYARKALVLLTKTMPVRDMAFIHRLYNSTDIFGAGRLATLRWDELASSQERDGLQFSFKYFQQLKGALMLPAGFTPNRIHAEADAGGDMGRTEQDFAWAEALTTPEVTDVQ